jgi:hypothetical protein
MYSARGRHTPIDFVCAEVAAFPLASEHAFLQPLEVLDPALSAATGSVWRSLESEAVRWGAFSLDEILAVRDSIWFESRLAEPRKLSTLLRDLARRALAIERDAADLVGPRDMLPDLRRRWRWLTFALPADLLRAALDDPRNYDADALLSPFLDRHLTDEGYAQVHLHLGAAVEFPHLWVGLQRALAERKGEACLASPGAVFSEGTQFASWMIRGAVLRLLTAAFLERFQHQPSFATFLTDDVYSWANSRPGATRAVIEAAVNQVGRGRIQNDPFTFADYESLLIELGGFAAMPLPERLADVFDSDPIAVDIGYDRAAGASPETLWIQKSLRYLDRRPDDPMFSRLFWQLVRLRCLFYRHVVQRPLTPGLQWFLRCFGRLKTAREPLLSTSLCVESALRIDGHTHGLKSLEVRTSPADSSHQLTQLIRSASTAARTAGAESQEPVEFGVVLHFTKDRGGAARQGLHQAHWQETAAVPAHPTQFRYGRFFEDKRREALATVEAIRADPEMLETIRGLDLCTDELGVPNWVMLPLLTEVRDGAATTIAESPNRGLKRLRTTVHVGEDFVHLMTGLRNTDQAVRYLGLREGDRLGHSLALGIEPQDWASRAGRVAIAAEEHLLNLAWEYEIAARGGGTELPSRQAYLEHNLATLGERIFGRPIAPRDIVQLTQRLHDPEQLERLGFPSEWPAFHAAHRTAPTELLWAYLTNGEVFKRGKDVIWVDAAADVDAMTRAQAMVRKEVGQRGIFVEMNPSSNLLIGDLGDVTKHPFWRLANADEPNGVPSIAVCIGTDDPIIFSTTLRQEYQLVYDALLAGGRSDVEARRWISRIRQNGLEARFTTSRRQT